MKMTITGKEAVGLVLGFLLLGAGRSALAQTPQDNWYLEQTWVRTGGSWASTNGGLSAPYGVAVGPDGRIYVADQGYTRIQVYLSDGTFSFSITNGFGGGQTFSQPRGMITDDAGNLYVADAGQHRVFVFDSNGSFIRTIGTTNGTGDGQLSGPVDVGVGPDNEVFILESGNSRVSVFGTDGAFKRKWGSPGLLAGQLYVPLSIAVSRDGRVYICQHEYDFATRQSTSMKEFDVNGLWKRTVSTFDGRGGNGSDWFHMGGASVRLDPGGFPCVVVSQFIQHGTGGSILDHRPYCKVWNRSGENFQSFFIDGTGAGQWVNGDFRNPSHAIGRDGRAVFCSFLSKKLFLYPFVFRDQFAVPQNAIPIPAVWTVKQRANSPLVDIDYEISDADDTNVHAAVLVFTNASSTMSLSNCVRQITLVEGTQTNIGSGVAANTVHRLTWNAGADWSVNIGECRVAILARDSRTNLLDIHYLNLPEERGMGPLAISRSPLNANDFMQVWWWLLATHDTGITISSNRLYGVGGGYDGLLLHATGTNTPNGRAYIYEKMHVREATPAEVLWAKRATMPEGSSPNAWAPTRQVGGRPAAVNEYGFDTGSWDTNTCKWVVPLN